MCRGEYLTNGIHFATVHINAVNFRGFVIGCFSAFLGQESTNNYIIFHFQTSKIFDKDFYCSIHLRFMR